MTKIFLIAAAIGATLLLFVAGGSTYEGGKFRSSDQLTGLGGSIPEPYNTIFKEAGSKFGVQPAFIAGIFVGEHRSIADSGYKKWPNPDGPWANS